MQPCGMAQIPQEATFRNRMQIFVVCHATACLLFLSACIARRLPIMMHTIPQLSILQALALLYLNRLRLPTERLCLLRRQRRTTRDSSFCTSVCHLRLFVCLFVCLFLLLFVVPITISVASHSSRPHSLIVSCKSNMLAAGFSCGDVVTVPGLTAEQQRCLPLLLQYLYTNEVKVKREDVCSWNSFVCVYVCCACFITLLHLSVCFCLFFLCPLSLYR